MHHDLIPSERDHEGKMARADLFKLAQYSFKLFKMLDDNQQLDGWVQAKITKAADYIASVYHYLEYEMKFSDYGQKLENSDLYVESIRNVYTQKLTEAKKKMDKLKASLDKKEKEMQEGFDEMEKYLKDKKGPQPSGSAGKKQGSRYGGSKQKDDEDKEKDVKEGFPTVADAKARHEKEKGTGKFDKKKISTGTVYTRKADKDVDDEEDTPKKNKKVKEGAKPDFLDMDKDGNKKEPMKKAVADKKKNPFAKKVKEDTRLAMSPAPAQKKSGIPSTATTTVPGMRATPADLKKANSSAALGEGKCNHSAKGKKCPVHGLKECGSMYESKKVVPVIQESAEVARLKDLTKKLLG